MWYVLISIEFWRLHRLRHFWDHCAINEYGEDIDSIMGEAADSKICIFIIIIEIKGVVCHLGNAIAHSFVGHVSLENRALRTAVVKNSKICGGLQWKIQAKTLGSYFWSSKILERY